jgi:hypothetical protein
VDWIQLHKYEEQLLAVVNTAMNFGLLKRRASSGIRVRESQKFCSMELVLISHDGYVSFGVTC